jgi:cytochrome c oxidase subunit 2
MPAAASQALYDLHREAFWICVSFAIAVLGAMIYSSIKFRRSPGALPEATMLRGIKVEIFWALVPLIILVVMAIPAAGIILKNADRAGRAAAATAESGPLAAAAPAHGRR